MLCKIRKSDKNVNKETFLIGQGHYKAQYTVWVGPQKIHKMQCNKWVIATGKYWNTNSEINFICSLQKKLVL